MNDHEKAELEAAMHRLLHETSDDLLMEKLREAGLTMYGGTEVPVFMPTVTYVVHGFTKISATFEQVYPIRTSLRNFLPDDIYTPLAA